MNKLTDAELETIIGGTALPSFFDQFRNENGKIYINPGTMSGGKFIPRASTSGGNLNKRGDSAEGLTKLLQLQKESGWTHVTLGTKGQAFAIDDILAKLG